MSDKVEERTANRLFWSSEGKQEDVKGTKEIFISSVRHPSECCDSEQNSPADSWSQPSGLSFEISLVGVVAEFWLH